jgi:tryptophan-rich sensory protein
MTWRVLAVSTVIITVLLYIVGSAISVSTGTSWYATLDKPAWQPPSWFIGLIWPYNFIVIAVVGSVIAWNAAPLRVLVFVIVLPVTVVLAIAWAYLFFTPHQLLGSAIVLTSAAVLTVPLTTLAFRERWWLGLIFLPYQLWIATAASLSWGYLAKAS